MKIWNDFLINLEKRLGTNVIRKWVATLQLVKFDAWNIYLQAENSFQILWFEEHIRPLVKNELFNENNHPIKVHLSLANERRSTDKSNSILSNKVEINSDDIDPYLTFDIFVPSENTSITYKFINEYSKEEAPLYNPIYLYGPPASGKTHLLISLAHAFKDQGLKVFYIKAQSFTQHVVDAIRFSNMQEFRKEYRNADVLIIDDIHILANKSATQEEFFHTFNTLHTNQKRIILSANCPPNQLTGIEPRLISRFEWGISLKLDKLEKSLFRKVIINKANILNLSLSKEIIDFIETSLNSIKSIQKALQSIALKSHLDNVKDLNLNHVKEYISNIIEEEKRVKLTPEKIIHIIAEQYGIQTSDILGKSQTKECTLPRQFSMFFIRELLKMPYIKIGSIFKRDHSTVMTSIKYIQSGLSSKSQDIFHPFLAITKNLDKF